MVTTIHTSANPAKKVLAGGFTPLHIMYISWGMSTAAKLARRHTVMALSFGRVLHHTTASGEVLSAGRHCTAVAGEHRWALVGHNSGRLETFSRASELGARLLYLAAQG